MKGTLRLSILACGIFTVAMAHYYQSQVGMTGDLPAVSFGRKTTFATLLCTFLSIQCILPTHASPISNTLNPSTALRMNHIQLKGTHNSYHREPPLGLRLIFESVIPSPWNYYYSHSSVSDQLSQQSVRSLEFDVRADSKGGLYANPLLPRIAGVPVPDEAKMKLPGAKVMHIADADVLSTCYTFRDCLEQVKAWSDAHPRHVPIPIDIEFKTNDEKLEALGGAKAEKWDEESLAALDEEIRSVFAEDRLVTPDFVRTDGLSLEESVLLMGWPTLEESRGMVMFYMDNDDGDIRDAYRSGGRNNLEGRVLFTNSDEGEDDAAFLKRNDPTGDNLEEIRELVRKGYFVRTRADVPIETVEKENNTVMRDLAWESGAQIVSTDFPAVGMACRYDTDYAVLMPGGGVARCNPINAPDGCKDDELE
ncbi:hypothetical protein K490DRAFT_62002 [Saccharata proteae CBS 121410]|uniref:PLC-like phosphodiesterase n=1 Tax=Saccharata proteae CBS 121410 TaxID=1314787 RepID=A0A9P4HZC9_9PEZI|nr:hypothetical protein K490DRAFT_62002 [Saccharata proteae CBS 121410]